MRLSEIRKVGILKTIYYNFKFCRFIDAIHFPLIVARNVDLRGNRKSLVFNDLIRWGGVTIGFNRDYNSGAPSSFSIYDKMVFIGKGNHSFGAGCSILVKKGAVLEIGNHFGCTGDSRIWVHKKVVIGENNLWSFGCTVLDGDGHKILDAEGERINNDSQVIFGDNVWLGCNCTVLKGSIIPSSCIIASESLITRCEIEGEGVIITTGGRVLKKGINWRQ